MSIEIAFQLERYYFYIISKIAQGDRLVEKSFSLLHILQVVFTQASGATGWRMKRVPEREGQEERKRERSSGSHVVRHARDNQCNDVIVTVSNPDQSQTCSIQTRQPRGPSGNSASSIGLWPDCSSASITERREFERLDALCSTARSRRSRRAILHRKSWSSFTMILLWIISAITTARPANKVQTARSELRWLIIRRKNRSNFRKCHKAFSARDLDQR